MYFDSHIHTAFSADSEMKALEAMNIARSKGMGLIFTEHMDFNYPGKLDFSFDPEKYMKEYSQYRGMFLLLGVEVGMSPAEVDLVKDFIGKVSFDQVIGSIHLVDGVDIYDKSFYDGKSKEEVYKRYFTVMKEMVEKYAFIDVLGHIDYIARYSPYEEKGINYDDFAEEIDGVLTAALKNNTIVELNTRRFGDEKAKDELKKIYTRYHELGGEYVTIGSDAHTPDKVGAYIPEAEALMAECNLAPVIFYERQLMPLAADY